MDRGRVGEDRESKETDGCPLTETSGKAIYEKLRAKHEKLTWSRRVAIRNAFHCVIHDTSTPIKHYV
jgi:hypothetical protein